MAHPYATVLRQRAGRLRELADTIERLGVTTLTDGAGPATWATRRARLCEDVLGRNVHQLHLAADELRERAFRFRQRADELDAARGVVA